MFIIWTNWIFEDKLTEQMAQQAAQELGLDYTEDEYIVLYNVVFGGLLLAYSCYFLFYEARQLVLTGIDYFAQIWNYLDIIPPILICYTVSATFFDESRPYLRSILAIASLLMWFKILYFLRIYKQTGYLIRMIIEVIYDMRIFLLVLMITIFGFANAFIIIARGYDGDSYLNDNDFINSILYTYRMILGDFNIDIFYSSQQSLTAWLMFLLCSVLNLIVMFNLLIAIISDSYAKVNSQSVQASNQERARMIAENSYLIPQSSRNELQAEVKQYVLVANEVSEPVAVIDAYTNYLCDIKTLINTRIDSLEKIINAK
jgi:hypothetical protein